MTPGTRAHALLRRISSVGFGACALAATLSLATGPEANNDLEALFSEGLAFAQEERLSEAEGAFRVVAQEGDSLLAGLAYHNLGVLALREASASTVSDGRPQAATAVRLAATAVRLAATAVRLAESSLGLQPGRAPTSRTLEIALRWSAEDPSTKGSNDSQTDREQSEGPDADTKRVSAGPEGSRGPEDGEIPPTFGRDAAVRLLASFRLLESEGTRSLILSMLKPSTNLDMQGRRGPPW